MRDEAAKVPLGRLLVPPPRGLDPDLARLIDALAREAARRDHAAENLAPPAATGHAGGATPDAA